MIDIVHVSAALVQLDEVADDRDEIFLGEHRVLGRHREPEPLIDLVPAHASEVVPLRAEEEPLERLFCGLDVRRVAGTEQRVDLLQRVLLDAGRILRDRVLDQRRLGTARCRRRPGPS